MHLTPAKHKKDRVGGFWCGGLGGGGFLHGIKQGIEDT